MLTDREVSLILAMMDYTWKTGAVKTEDHARDLLALRDKLTLPKRVSELLEEPSATAEAMR